MLSLQDVRFYLFLSLEILILYARFSQLLVQSTVPIAGGSLILKSKALGIAQDLALWEIPNNKLQNKNPFLKFQYLFWIFVRITWNNVKENKKVTY